MKQNCEQKNGCTKSWGQGAHERMDYWLSQWVRIMCCSHKAKIWLANAGALTTSCQRIVDTWDASYGFDNFDVGRFVGMFISLSKRQNPWNRSKLASCPRISFMSWMTDLVKERPLIVYFQSDTSTLWINVGDNKVSFLSQLLHINLNNMVCPAVSDPFSGPYYRIIACCHQPVMIFLIGKIFCLVGHKFVEALYAPQSKKAE